VIFSKAAPSDELEHFLKPHPPHVHFQLQMRFPEENWYELLSSSYQACILALQGGDWVSVLPKPSVGVGRPNYYVQPIGRNSTWKDMRLSVSKIGSGRSRIASHGPLGRSSHLCPRQLALGDSEPADLKHKRIESQSRVIVADNSASE
jgi:hypothetical protein